MCFSGIFCPTSSILIPGIIKSSKPKKFFKIKRSFQILGLSILPVVTIGTGACNFRRAAASPTRCFLQTSTRDCRADVQHAVGSNIFRQVLPASADRCQPTRWFSTISIGRYAGFSSQRLWRDDRRHDHGQGAESWIYCAGRRSKCTADKTVPPTFSRRADDLA